VNCGCVGGRGKETGNRGMTLLLLPSLGKPSFSSITMKNESTWQCGCWCGGRAIDTDTDSYLYKE
jgi:hypothetical protein